MIWLFIISIQIICLLTEGGVDNPWNLRVFYDIDTYQDSQKINHEVFQEVQDQKPAKNCFRRNMQQRDEEVEELTFEGGTTNVSAVDVFGESDTFLFEAVFGPDDRVPVATDDIMKFPFNTVGLLTFDCPCRSCTCTGTLIGPRTVVTAAHCVLDISSCLRDQACCSDLQCHNFKFTPSFNRTNGATTEYSVEAATIPTGFQYDFEASQDIDRFGAYDIAILKLSSEASMQIETMAYAYQSCTTQTLKMFTVGYPSDKGYDADVMVESACEVEVDTCSGVSVFPHTCDTFGGMSGSTIWAEENGRLVIRGIHTRADLLEERNYGVLFTREAGQFISDAQVSS